MLNPDVIPPEMLSAKRWMITTRSDREDKIIKRPRAPFDRKPDDWPEFRSDGRKAYWPSSWDVPQAWGTFEQACSYLDRHSLGRHLCFVTHPGPNTEKTTRWVCIDIDGAYDEHGGLRQGVQDLLDSLPDTYVEISASGSGVHVIILVEDCTLYRTVHGTPLSGAKADILFSGQVVITGDPLTFFCGSNVATISEQDFLQFFPGVAFKPKSETGSLTEFDWPDVDRTKVPTKWKHLIRSMQDVDCIEGEGGQGSLFRAACSLARAGVPIEDSEPLLRFCNSIPDWSTEELRYIAECAYKDCTAKNEVNTNNVHEEFDVVEEKKRPQYLFVPIPANDLEEMDLRLDWIVEGLLVDKEPLMIGGREKAFKTSMAMDLAISIATGRPALGRFNVMNKRSVTFFTGEIGAPACKNLVRRIRSSKNIEEGTLDRLTIVTTVPSFTDVREKRSLEKYLKNEKPDVVVFDPLYFCMMGAEVGDMYSIGGYLKEITQICKSYDTWPWFVHHARKDSSKEYQPMELGDLYGSGVSAFARQWILSAHSDPYRNGVANLFVNVGGSSTGDCGLWRLRVDEGIADELCDRRWDVHIDKGDGVSTKDIEQEIIAGLEVMGGEGKIKDIALTINRDQRFTKSVLSEISKRGTISFSNGAVRLCE